MASSLDATALSTLSLLESRLLRVEHLLYGTTATPPRADDDSASKKIDDLERRFSGLVSRIRVYGELLRMYKSHPSLFHSPPSADPPTQLSPDAVKATVIASAAIFPATASSLTAVNDCPIPDPSQSAALVTQMERLRALEATQIAQMTELADLRTRSERVIRHWYEGGVLGCSQFVADIESRVERAEIRVRRSEKEQESQKKL